MLERGLTGVADMGHQGWCRAFGIAAFDGAYDDFEFACALLQPAGYGDRQFTRRVVEDTRRQNVCCNFAVKFRPTSSSGLVRLRG